MNNITKMVKGAGIAAIFNISGFAIMFFFKLLAARYFGPDIFGNYALIETIFSLCIILAGMSLSSGIPRYIPFYKSKKKYKLLKGYKNFVISLSLLGGGIFSFILFFGSQTITSSFNFPSQFSIYLKIVAIAIPLHLFDEYLRQLFVSDKKIFWQRLSRDVIEKSTLLIGMLLIICFENTILLLFMFFTFSKFIPTIFDFIMSKKLVKERQVDSAGYRPKEWLNFSLPLLFTGISVHLINKLDHLMIGWYMEPENLGIYSITFSIANFILFFQSSFSAIFLLLISTNLAKNEHQEITLLFKKSASWIFGMTTPLVLIALIYSKQLLKIIYGTEYSAGYLPLSILAIGMLINISTGLNHQILLLHKKTKARFYTILFVALLNIFLNFLLIPYFGLIGAAIASAISISLQQIILYILAKQCEKLDLDWQYYFKFLIVGIPISFISKYIYRIIPNHILSLAISLIFYFLSYFICLLVLRTFTKEDFKLVWLIEKKFNLNLNLLKKIVKKFY